ncbi:hypothetical protein MPTK1_5g08300 [Marchantia polymorpha subsp. ruderalis]|uniref:Uncharacterized protein n=2 Tax=Marchantia polymorpha TaxID=3197 RepID=A0AAF6BG75_MARPO|nr:hypothetical protein MARPO_0086s0034 [Marchantia polymorpha]BBN11009.1 hypothetical protein Mp_5g08300 [Marchantia polymorpha subsp. ruderalis]|eukprot:PTQ33707.1 hypothetical protein MARPO_0086s0034 [Marchantia polymorpha]
MHICYVMLNNASDIRKARCCAVPASFGQRQLGLFATLSESLLILHGRVFLQETTESVAVYDRRLGTF